jgi:hypothetical protein
MSAGGRHAVFGSASDNLIAGSEGGTFLAERGGGLLWGDIDCSGAAGVDDALVLMMLLEDLTEPPDECPAEGTPVQTGFGAQDWGDWDCDGAVAGADVMPLLRQSAALPPAPGCPAPGSDVQELG